MDNQTDVQLAAKASVDNIATPKAALAYDDMWKLPTASLLIRLSTRITGLNSTEVRARQRQYGQNSAAENKRKPMWLQFAARFQNPLVIILLVASGLSAATGDIASFIIVAAIVLVSLTLDFVQETRAQNAVDALRQSVAVRGSVRRDRAIISVPVDQLVPGDIVELIAGDLVPADARLLESRDLFINQALLTGEPFPVEKLASDAAQDVENAAGASNTVFAGTSVISGTATILICWIGGATSLGHLAASLAEKPPATAFAAGINRFGLLIMRLTMLMVLFVLVVNISFHRPVLESLMFALALAVGLTPELLPMIVTVTLARSALALSKRKVIVKRLSAIHDLGAMDMLCTDKTGTITEGEVKLQSVNDLEGKESARCLFYVYLNSAFETGFASPIDAAVRNHGVLDITAWKKLDEVPYDFLRKRLTVLVSGPDGNVMITKGALAQVLAVCGTAEGADGTEQPIQSVRQQIEDRFVEYSNNGQRTLGLARKKLGATSTIGKVDETGMCFMGFVLFSDPLKSGIAATIERLRGLGVSLKVITGDNVLVAASVAREIGFDKAEVLSGAELKVMSDGALLNRVGKVNVFAEVEPNEKERIIRALRKAGNVVGYMGDGINDASALHAADVGLSVESAVDVAKEVADIVLLEKNLDVLIDGIREGRITFANTLKYVLIATSANFGNMFSMAGASLLLPFLPLLPKQILLTNMLTDLPAMTISSDGVDEEMLVRPRRWDIGFIRSFMLTFGVLSSIFDYLTFSVLLYLFHANTDQFRTAWFVESVLSASLILLVVRSRRPFFHSRPSRRLLLATLGVGIVTLALPYLPFAALFGLVPLPFEYLGAIAVVVALYVASGELAKHLFYRRFDPGLAPLG